LKTLVEPEGQLEHADAPDTDEYRPGTQSVHVIAPNTEYCPAAQSEHKFVAQYCPAEQTAGHTA